MNYPLIYELMGKSAIDSDCGKLCQAACCQRKGPYKKEVENPNYSQELKEAGYEEEPEMGMYLFPGEERYAADVEGFSIEEEMAEDYGFPESWGEKVYFMTCMKVECERDKRPIQCRTFPLMPHLTEEGELRLIHYVGILPYRCPLITESMPLSEDFIKGVYEGWKLLLQNPGIYDFVWEESRLRTEEGKIPHEH